MCTAIRWSGFFGRTLDLEYSYEEQVTVTPRNFPLPFRRMETMNSHYAIMGVAHVAEGYPLYYDAVNEKGLAMAGLNFPGNACYHAEKTGRDNVTPFELVPWVLGRCSTVNEAERLLERVNLTDTSFNGNLPLTPLHWMIADRERSIVAEPMAEGLKVYENPTDVMTNNPPFPEQLERGAAFSALLPDEPEGVYDSRGMGAVGLPGDWSSSSRFARAAFVRKYAADGGVGQFFRILGSVEVPEGCIKLGDGRQVKTVYTSACHMERGVYYYTTYESHRITGVDMHREHLDGTVLTCYPLRRKEDIRTEN